MKTNKIVLAKKQFMEDLQKDEHFLEFKKGCIMEDFSSYGCVTACSNAFVINHVGDAPQTLISKFQKNNTIWESLKM